MNRLISSIRHGRGSSLFSLLTPKPSFASKTALRHHRFTLFPQNDGGESEFHFVVGKLWNRQNPPLYERFWRDHQAISTYGDDIVFCTLIDSRTHVRGFSSANWGWRRNDPGQTAKPNVNARPDFMQGIENINSRSGNNMGQNVNANANAHPDFMQDKENIDSGRANDAETGRNSRPMDIVRGIVDKDNVMEGPSMYYYEHDADFVHIKMLRNNTFVTVTDSKGNIKLSGSAGSLKDLKSGQKLSRYAAEATAEVVGRRSRGLGLKSVVMKVNGFTHFRRKRQAIMSWREGFTDSRGDRNPIVYIEDTTRKPHNGCRLPKKRRI